MRGVTARGRERRAVGLVEADPIRAGCRRVEDVEVQVAGVEVAGAVVAHHRVTARGERVDRGQQTLLRERVPAICGEVPTGEVDLVIEDAAIVVRTLDRASAAGGHRLLVLWEPEDIEIHSVPEGRRRGQAHPAGVRRLRGGGGLEQ